MGEAATFVMIGKYDDVHEAGADNAIPLILTFLCWSYCVVVEFVDNIIPLLRLFCPVIVLHELVRSTADDVPRKALVFFVLCSLLR